jgi:hypothetical protein
MKTATLGLALASLIAATAAYAMGHLDAAARQRQMAHVDAHSPNLAARVAGRSR